MSNVDYPQHCQPISHSNNNSDLIKRLKNLSEALQNADRNEDVGDKTRFSSLANHLTNEKFLNNSSREVQIWLACCIADLFRIFSPEVPISDSDHLRETLLFVIRALKGLANPSNPLFRRYFYLLENISATNCVCLCLTLPPDSIAVVIRQFLKSALEAVNGKEWSLPSRELSVELNDSEENKYNESDDKNERKEKMHSLLLTIGMMLLSDVDHVSDSIMDVLFFYLINPQKTNYKESYILARSLVIQSANPLERPIEVLLTRSLLSGALPSSCSMVGSTVSKLHEVIIELHDISSDLITPVIPQLGNFLRSDDHQEREMTTKTIGFLLRSKKCNIYEDHATVWNCYIERFKDRIPAIREICAKHCSRILVNHSHLRGPLCDALCRLLCDTEESVRIAALAASIEAASMKLESVNEQLITKCCDRLKDKKLNIRIEALSKLMKLHAKVVQGDDFTDSDKQVVSVIPEQTLTLYLHPTLKDEKYYLERFLQVNIIPFRMSTPQRIKWMCNLYCRLSGAATNAFYMIIRQNSVYRRLMKEVLLLISGSYSDEEKSSHIESRIQKISSFQPNPSHYMTMLKAFTNLLSTKQAAFDIVKDLVGYEHTVDEYVTKGMDLIHIVSSCELFTKETENTCRHFVERFSLLILDTNSATTLVKQIAHEQADMNCGKTGSDERVFKLVKMLRSWSEAYPLLFSSDDSISHLLKLIESDNNVSVEGGLEVLKNMCSQGSFKCSEKFWYTNLCSVVRRLIVTEENGFGRVAKLSVYLLCLIVPKEDLIGISGEFVAVAKKLLERITILNPEVSVNALRALSAICKATHADIFEILDSAATDTLVPLILSDQTDSSDCQTVDPLLPVKKQSIPIFTNVKVYSLKLLSRFLNGSVNLDRLATKTVKLLITIVDSGGQLHDDDTPISPVEKAVLRSVAGSCLLKMCSIQKYVSLLGASGIVTLSKLVYDDVEFVRTFFMTHLNKGLMRNRLSIEFASLYGCVCLLKPNMDLDEMRVKSYRDTNKIILTSFIQNRLKLSDSAENRPDLLPYYQPEYAIAYAIYVLSAQPSFSSVRDVDTLAYLQECLWYLMEPYLNSKSSFDAELIWKTLETLKTSTNAVSAWQRKEGMINDEKFREENKKMWAITDLAMVMVSYRAKIIINNDSKKAALSNRFFEPLKSKQIKVHAPVELIEDEKRRNGKPPTDRKRLFGLFGAQNVKPRKGANTTKREKTITNIRRTKLSAVAESEDSDDASTSTDHEEIAPRSKRRCLTSTQEPVKSASMKPIPEANDSNGKQPNQDEVGESASAPVSPTVRQITRKGRKDQLKQADTLEDLNFSPIRKDSVVRKNLAKGRCAKTSGLTSSTPVRRSVTPTKESSGTRKPRRAKRR